MDPITMMMIASLGSAAIGGASSWFAGKDQSQAAANALQLQQQQWQQNQGNLNPWIKTGQGADYTLAQLYGLPGKNGKVSGPPNYNSFFNSPDYQFALKQGQQATENLLSAKGGLASGGGLAALNQFGQGLATQQYQNYVQRLMGISGMGEDAAKALTNSSNQATAGMAGSIGAGGQANASGLMGIGNAAAGGLNSMGNNYMLYSLFNKNKNPSAYGSPQQYASGSGQDYSTTDTSGTMFG